MARSAWIERSWNSSRMTHPDPFEERIALKVANHHPFGDDLDSGVTPALFIKAHRIAYLFTELYSSLLGDTRCDSSGRDTSRLEHDRSCPRQRASPESRIAPGTRVDLPAPGGACSTHAPLLSEHLDELREDLVDG